MEPSDQITEWLKQARNGDKLAEDHLIRALYPDLRRRARFRMAQERKSHTLQSTILVHEAFMQLIRRRGTGWRDRAHFLAAAAKVMHNILVDHARRIKAKKRGGLRVRVSLRDSMVKIDNQHWPVLAVHEALKRLKRVDPMQARVVELAWFGDLTAKEIASVLEVSERTVERELSLARAWLRLALGSKPRHGRRPMAQS
jgi:RNA polymerase sigma factor (TIGR02999 family)